MTIAECLGIRHIRTYVYVTNCEKTVECLLSSMQCIATCYSYVCICAIISDSLVDLTHTRTYVHTYASIILSDKITEYNSSIIGNFCAKNTLHSGI